MTLALLSVLPEFLVVCFCAEWCGTCREFRPPFIGLSAEFPQLGFRWIDIEDDASWIGEFDGEDFPTILIQRAEWVLFYGAMPPQPAHLRQMLNTLLRQSPEQSREFAFGTKERSAWQRQYNFRRVLEANPGRLRDSRPTP